MMTCPLSGPLKYIHTYILTHTHDKGIQSAGGRAEWFFLSFTFRSQTCSQTPHIDCPPQTNIRQVHQLLDKYQSIDVSPPRFPSYPSWQAISPRQLQIWLTDRQTDRRPSLSTYGSLQLSCIAVSGDGHMHFSQSLKCLIQNGSVTPREQNPH